MVNNQAFQATFAELRAILLPYAAKLKLDGDSPEGYSLSTPPIEQLKRELHFAAVQIKKNYVSYYLMPVYVFPELLDQISPALKKRMQGKSCFNFKAPDPTLFAELVDLTAQGYKAYQRAYDLT